MSERVRCYSPSQVIEKDVLDGLERLYTRRMPFSACIHESPDSPVVLVEEFYEDHIKKQQIESYYDHPVKVTYFSGEFGQHKSKPLTRVSWSAVSPAVNINVE